MTARRVRYIKASSNSSGKYMRYGLRIETGTERTAIVDTFNIIQKVRDTGIHLEVGEEQCRITRGSKRQAGGYGPLAQCLSDDA